MAKSLMLAMALILFGSSIVSATAQEKPQISTEETMTTVRFLIGKNVAVATLYNSAATRDLIAQLPQTLTFKDFASKEKIGYPPKKLSAKNDSSSKVPSEGDVAYYAPWGNIAVFYKGIASTTSDLHILGRIVSGREYFNIPGDFEVKIEVAQ